MRNRSTKRDRGTFVHVDRHGQVRSPLRYRLIKIASYSTLATVFGGGAIYYTMMFGPVGTAIIAVLEAFARCCAISVASTKHANA